MTTTATIMTSDSPRHQVKAGCMSLQIQDICKAQLKHWKTFQANYLKPLLESGLIEMTIPNKPNSSNQKYRLTDKGRAMLEDEKS